MHSSILALTALLAIAACGGAPGPDPGYGADPKLPEPHGGPLPTINTARPVGWAEGAAPIAPAGFAVTRYAEGLSHPRWVYLLANNDVLVAQSASRPSRGEGVVGWIANMVERGAGAFADEGVDQVTLLRDSDLDGDVDETHVFRDGLNQPFGMALLGDHIYIANTDAVLRFRYAAGATSLEGEGEVVLNLPYREGGNGHWTRSLAVSPDGSKLYVAVGSASNIADGGMEAEQGRAAIWEFNPDGSEPQIYASGLRNPVGMAWASDTGRLWVAVNERDMLGDNLVPDYVTSVTPGGFYGWPYSYYGQHVDERVRPRRPDLVATALTPDYALGAHTASLGLYFYRDEAFPRRYLGGAFIGQHGSWNRSEPAGYKVVFVPFARGLANGPVEDFLTGFLNGRGQARGRPVGVATDQTGALLVADDVGGIVWRVAWAD